MRPPWREVGPMLGAAGQPIVVPIRAPYLARPVRFALIRNVRDPLEKPAAYASLNDLVLAIGRRRRGAAIRLLDAAVRLGGRDGKVDGVSIWLIEAATGDERSYLGWAYLNGHGRQVLEGALPPHLATLGERAA